MIVDMPNTSTGAIAKRLVDLRETGGAVALGRVLTLVVPTDDERAEAAIAAANEASREHPCRIIVLARGERRGTIRLDGQIRVGGDAGASEVVVLRSYGPLSDHADSMVIPLLLPDAPVVTWWPGEPPEDPAADPIGAMGQRRITDSAASADPPAALRRLAACHGPGDTDFAWTRLTLWRGYLAAALDGRPEEPITAAAVTGAVDSPSSDLLAAWLTWALECPVTRVNADPGSGIIGVRLERASGAVELVRPDGRVATLTQPGQPDRRLTLARRADSECLAEELRRLDPDDIFGDVVTRGLPALEEEDAIGVDEAQRRGAITPAEQVRQRGEELDAHAAEVARGIAGAEPSGIELEGPSGPLDEQGRPAGEGHRPQDDAVASPGGDRSGESGESADAP
ncbi:glucose-6-phosphate dehydrogenase assembly protein OpcA [Quadrisphaera sp. DSM 44207]|uniref:glucose-6-phosphate dehydrogenase assembly protein OpcA n=1 Tax=Quadrisphaera sp. DSM 44207 TaxID=1881057 RepID=UPI000882E1FB|nr:glucose-6-phosphate dehydrogenase assembly protein OpcA [Quadrisphaera sp. DSM 44207]SDQ44241.1 glucose-6-phosphate dehydrogenase assembly protein OpcA [Quadrisphaera sp. DSM 44207]